MARFRPALAGLMLLAGATPCPVGAASPAGGPGQRPGPDVLYAAPAAAPQFENAGIWRAEPILVAGASAYRRGEFLYQDFLYDDLGAGDAYRYPNDPRYAGNAADLVELRIKPLAGETAFRLTYNTMVDPMAVGTTIGLGGAATAMPMPHGANARMPAEVFVTVHGFEADAVDAAAGVTVATGLPVAVDPARRQVEVRVPTSVFSPHGRQGVRIGAATGPWSGLAYVPQSAASFFNVAFRQSETAGAWRSAAQAAALASGDLSGFAAHVDFAKLAAEEDDESGVPSTGFQGRIFASAHEERQGRGDAVSRKPGCPAPCILQYPGRLQPYGLYVPPGPPPAGGYGLTIDLHGCGQTYAIGLGSRRQQQLGARGAGDIVLTPEARGDCYWYYGRAAADVFEAWADVARRYRLDPDRTSIVGSSMGGYGALKLAAAYPDLFARAGGVAPCPGAGIEWTGTRLPGGRARALGPMLPGLRNVPVMSWLATGDQTCRYRAQVATLSRLAALGYRFSTLTFDGPDHNGLATAALSDAQPLADFLGTARVVRDPARVTYVLNPAVSEPEFGLRADHAYWLSGIAAARPSTMGNIDVDTGVREAFLATPVNSSGALANGLAFTSSARLEDPYPMDAGERMRVTARGVGAATVDAARARTGCRPAVSFATDERLELRLAGCNRTYVGRTVCHARPIFAAVARAPRSDVAERRTLVVGGKRSMLLGNRVRVDLRSTPNAVARVRVASIDPNGRSWVRLTAHRFCAGS
ncbi:MAG: alpha/beta hydrolase-fold protein [Solirubrobacteraceae bacterium]